MSWLILALVLSATALAVLLVPVHLRFEVRSDGSGTPPVRARVRWLFVSWDSGRARTRRHDKQTARRPTTTQEPTSPPGQRRGGAVTSRRVRALLGTRGFPTRAVQFAIGVLQVLRPRRIHVRGRLGFDDPATTGEIVGVVNGLASALPHAGPHWSGWDVRLEPLFVEPTLEVRATMDWSVSAGALLWPVATFATSPVTWRALFAVRRA